LKKIVSKGILVDSLTRWVGELFFDYEYLREYEAQIRTARNLV
jgi:adenosyl cobinamide kinase/adenosyl cobinamide phosphate guanylyltransferase